MYSYENEEEIFLKLWTEALFEDFRNVSEFEPASDLGSDSTDNMSIPQNCKPTYHRDSTQCASTSNSHTNVKQLQKLR